MIVDLSINIFAYLISNISVEDEILRFKSNDDCVTSGFISDSVDLSLNKYDGIVTIISTANMTHTEPTAMKGRKKPPMSYNQAPMAGPNQKLGEVRAIRIILLEIIEVILISLVEL